MSGETLTPFGAAAPGDRAVVYTCPPGDEYGWVIDSIWFDEIDEPERVKRQVWQLIEETEVVFHPCHEPCPHCGNDGELLSHPDFGYTKQATCEACDGTGLHPLAGQMETLPDLALGGIPPGRVGRPGRGRPTRHHLR